MAALNLVETHKKDLLFLKDQTAQVCADFCKLGWSYLNKGPNTKLYQTVSQKLQVDVKQVQCVVEGVANLFIEAIKNEITEEGFKETLKGQNFSEESSSILYSEFLEQKDALSISLSRSGMQHFQFKDLEWRFETQVSSRSAKNQCEPRVVIKLDLEKVGETKSLCLQSDIPNIIHLSQVINQALQDSKTQHYKRIQRAVT